MLVVISEERRQALTALSVPAECLLLSHKPLRGFQCGVDLIVSNEVVDT